jgi:hypothetical protein
MSVSDCCPYYRDECTTAKLLGLAMMIHFLVFFFFSNWEMCVFIFPGGENNHLKENHLQEAGS